MARTVPRPRYPFLFFGARSSEVREGWMSWETPRAGMERRARRRPEGRQARGLAAGPGKVPMAGG